MKTAIIVLNYNDSVNTTKFVGSVIHYNSIDKIIVVDNNSSKEGELDKLKKLEDNTFGKVEVISTDRNGGYAYGNNFALKYIDSKYDKEFEYVIISNPDVFCDDDVIEKTKRFLNENDDVMIASPRMNFVTGPARRAAWKKRSFAIDIANSTRITEFLLFLLLKKGEYSKKDYAKKVLYVDNTAGSFFIAKHDLFKKIDYFDENTFLFYEEDILGEKVKNAGYKIVLLNELNFMHYESKSIGKVMNLFKKIDILFDSRIYYHKIYNNVGQVGIFIFNILRITRKIELLIEIPIRKIINMLKRQK